MLHKETIWVGVFFSKICRNGSTLEFRSNAEFFALDSLQNVIGFTSQAFSQIFRQDGAFCFLLLRASRRDRTSCIKHSRAILVKRGRFDDRFDTGQSLKGVITGELHFETAYDLTRSGEEFARGIGVFNLG